MDSNTEKKIVTIFNDLLVATKKKIESENIESILKNRTPITAELFSDNLKDYLYFVVCQRVTTSFSTRLGKVMEKICEELIVLQGGKIIKKPQPYDLKFKIRNKEYWIELKSINGQNSSNKQTIEELKKNAEKKGKIFRLCIYNDDNFFREDYKLNGIQFWDLMLGEENSRDKIFRIIHGKGIEFSIKQIIEDNFKRLLTDFENMETKTSYK